jgi:hypothetical protein
MDGMNYESNRAQVNDVDLGHQRDNSPNKFLSSSEFIRKSQNADFFSQTKYEANDAS